ncbi:hypothetical protein [Streptomyces sp. NPDC087300]|uniref:hypothetical protein n=1 Tax=Streptomyces sp. NPDC087300 TaxID=3365780 RepID=UPI0037FE2B5B
MLTLGDVELWRGRNTLTFSVKEPAVVDDVIAYAVALDRFTLTRLPGPVLRDAYVGDPRHSLGTVRHGERARLHFRLAGRAEGTCRVHYTVTDYFGERATSGTVAVPSGRSVASGDLPQLPPGHYRVAARIVRHGEGRTAQQGEGPQLVRNFACLPQRRGAGGDRFTGPPRANRFGVNAFVSSLVPPARLDAFAAGMKEMGVGCVRDANAWPAAEPARGTYTTEHYDRVTRTLRRHGLTSLEVLSPAPEWAMTDASLPLPADLRDAYRYTRHLAAGRDAAAVPEALQLSNEPDVDVTRSTGDAHAAYVKAAALGIADTPRPPLTVLPGIAEAGHFQRLMLANDVVRYADVWAFHGYPDPAEQSEPDFPGAAEEQHALSRAHGADIPLWMTECGAFLEARPGRDLTPSQQAVQARYLVRSTVKGLAAGNDRQFWFGGPPLHDEGVYFGLLSREFQPWPAYSACAALTSLLGDANVIGPVEGLPPGAFGHVFDTGEECGSGERGAGRVTVTVAWAEKPVRTQLPLRGRCVAVHDIMGRRIDGGDATAIPAPVGRGVRVELSRDPVYVVCVDEAGNGRPSVATSHGERLPRRLSTAEHIVLSQRYAARDAAPGKEDGDAEPPLGYRLGVRTRMTLDVYNFDAVPRTVTVTAHPADGWTARARGPRRVRVPAMGRVGVGFTLVAGRGVRRRVDHRLAFSAVLDDGARVPRSVAMVHLGRAARRGAGEGG